MNNIQAERQRGKALVLAHFYFQRIADKAGMMWDNDNDAEISDMIDHIIASAVEEAKAEIKNQQAQIEKLEQRLERMNEALEGVYFRGK